MCETERNYFESIFPDFLPFSNNFYIAYLNLKIKKKS